MLCLAARTCENRDVSGEVLQRLTFSSPVGQLVLLASELGLRAVLWGDTPEEWRRSRIDRSSTVHEPHPTLVETAEQLEQYFEGNRRDFDLRLDVRGTNFQRIVWNSLTRIPFGTTLSYQTQAASIDRPTAVRAVASANGKNPLSIVVPCHRVIGSNGQLSGFAGGLDAKRWLIDHEKQR